LIVPSSDPDTILVPSGENATELMQSLWAFVFSINCSSLPDSQTLIVPSADPDTILAPSGENATEMMSPLWALVFSLNSPSFPARQVSRR
jgi:hypothetical protein